MGGNVLSPLRVHKDSHDHKTPEERKKSRREKFLSEFAQTEIEFERLLELTIHSFYGNLDCQRFVRLYFGYGAECMWFPRLAHQLGANMEGANSIRALVISRMYNFRALELYQKAANELGKSASVFDRLVFNRAKKLLGHTCSPIAYALKQIHAPAE